MLYEAIDDAEEITPTELRRRYERAVADAIESVGVGTAAEETGVERERLTALLGGEAPDLTVSEAADLLSLSEDYPDADAIRVEVRDSLMLGMSSAVVDVDTLASELDGDLGPREIQQKIEGRQEMSLEEYARIAHHLAVENPY